LGEKKGQTKKNQATWMEVGEEESISEKKRMKKKAAQ